MGNEFETLPHEAGTNVSRHYRNRVAAIKHDLPLNYRDIIYRHFPGYKSPKAKHRINNVMTLRTADMHLTDILERIAKRELR
jgi:hypothetical protein